MEWDGWSRGGWDETVPGNMASITKQKRATLITIMRWSKVKLYFYIKEIFTLFTSSLGLAFTSLYVSVGSLCNSFHIFMSSN